AEPLKAIRRTTLYIAHTSNNRELSHTRETLGPEAPETSAGNSNRCDGHTSPSHDRLAGGAPAAGPPCGGRSCSHSCQVIGCSDSSSLFVRAIMLALRSQ